MEGGTKTKRNGKSSKVTATKGRKFLSEFLGWRVVIM